MLVHKRIRNIGVGEIVVPVTIDLDLTDACDHECPWCEYAMFRRRSIQHLPKYIACQLLDDIRHKAVKGLIVSGGGEPTMYPWFPEIAEKIAELNLSTMLITHGGHLEKYREVIAATFTEVRISLDSASECSYRLNHKDEDGAFERILTNIRALRKATNRTRIGISFLISQNNYHDLVELSDILMTIPVDYLLLKFSRFATDNAWLSKEILVGIESIVDRLRNVVSTYYRPPAKCGQGIKLKGQCRTTWLKTLVVPNGRVFICNQRRKDDSMALGSLHESRFWDIWNSTHHIKTYSDIDTSKCPPCRHDEYNQLLKEAEQRGFPDVTVESTILDSANLL